MHTRPFHYLLLSQLVVIVTFISILFSFVILKMSKITLRAQKLRTTVGSGSLLKLLRHVHMSIKKKICRTSIFKALSTTPHA